MSNHDYILIDGQIHHHDDVGSTLSATSLGGLGCFETLRSYQGKFFLLEEHIERFNQGMQFLGMQKRVSVQYIRGAIHTLQKHNALLEQDSVVKFGCLKSPKGTGHIYIKTRPIPESNPNWTLATVATPVEPKKKVETSLKLSNRVCYERAAVEAKRQGANDALMLNEDGFVSETTIANLFWIKERTLYTPSVDCDILAGITRKCIIEYCRNEDVIKVKEGKYSKADLLTSECVFVCNSVREIIPIQQIDDTEFKYMNSIIHKIKESFLSILKNKLR